MKAKKSLLLLFITFFFSCSTDNDPQGTDGNTPPADNPDGNSTIVVFENSTFTGNALIKYSDNSSISGNFDNGTMNIPLSSSGQKTIASIQPQNEPFILIGRKEGANIRLNYSNGILSHRIAVNGLVPIGSYAEFQLINSSSTTLAASYQMEADLNFMSLPWSPIGGSSSINAFKGSFDGNNHKIQNINVDIDGAAGVFGLLSSTPTARYIRNLTIESGNISGTQAAGGIVGAVEGYGVTIENCQNYAMVTCSGAGGAGGIIGEDGSNCCTISNCKNYGDIISGTEYAGGLAGNTKKVENSQNYGMIVVETDVYFVGGISGMALDIISCANYGSIVINNNSGGGASIGGIVGYCVSTVINCDNSGNIATGNNVNDIGGIVGLAQTPNNLTACRNSGNISSSGYVNSGGIVGTLIMPASTTKLYACYNSGTITNLNGGTFNGTGGIIGFCNNSFNSPVVNECYNTGAIYGTLQSLGNMNGAIIGKAYVSNINAPITSNCFWKDIASDGANSAIGRVQMNIGGVITEVPGLSDVGTIQFSSTSWPSVATSWMVGNGTNGMYWSSLGSWNNGNPIFPRLHFEN